MCAVPASAQEPSPEASRFSPAAADAPPSAKAAVAETPTASAAQTGDRDCADFDTQPEAQEADLAPGERRGMQVEVSQFRAGVACGAARSPAKTRRFNSSRRGSASLHPTVPRTPPGRLAIRSRRARSTERGGASLVRQT